MASETVAERLAARPLDSADDCWRLLCALAGPAAAKQAPQSAAAIARTRRLLAAVGEPQADLRIAHIAGSKGKGSTALLLEALALAGSWRVGCFTSPHLQHWQERIRIDGANAADPLLVDCFESLRPAVAELAASALGAPRFFELLTAAALLAFARGGVRLAIVEAGVGGRLDATNLLRPALCAITSIEGEHLDKLGPDLADVAAHKAGIIKPGVPAVIGRLPGESAAVVAAQAAAVGAPLHRLGEDFDCDDSEPGARFSAGEITAEFDFPGNRGPMRDNAALALMAAELLALGPLPRLAAAAFRHLRLPGRCELLAEAPLRIVDGAHTAASARALAAALGDIPAKKMHFVLSFSPGKDWPAVITALAGQATTIWLTRADESYSLAPDEVDIDAGLLSGARLIRCDAPGEALAKAVAVADGGDLICATGSVYMAGFARGVWCAAGSSCQVPDDSQA